MLTAKERTEKLKQRMDEVALAGLHRVIPAFKDESSGEPMDAYLTSAEIRKMLRAILQACKEEGLKFVETIVDDSTRYNELDKATYTQIEEIYDR